MSAQSNALHKKIISVLGLIKDGLDDEHGINPKRLRNQIKLERKVVDLSHIPDQNFLNVIEYTR